MPLYRSSLGNKSRGTWQTGLIFAIAALLSSAIAGSLGSVVKALLFKLRQVGWPEARSMTGLGKRPSSLGQLQAVALARWKTG